jgi:hypothetical protein
MILFLFNKSEDSPSNNKMVEISIPPIHFDKDEYKSFSIFIYYSTDVLELIKINKLYINKEFTNFKKRLL